MAFKRTRVKAKRPSAGKGKALSIDMNVPRMAHSCNKTIAIPTSTSGSILRSLKSLPNHFQTPELQIDGTN